VVMAVGGGGGMQVGGGGAGDGEVAASGETLARCGGAVAGGAICNYDTPNNGIFRFGIPTLSFTRIVS
jgi:hypothetical protein